MFVKIWNFDFWAFLFAQHNPSPVRQVPTPRLGSEVDSVNESQVMDSVVS